MQATNGRYTCGNRRHSFFLRQLYHELRFYPFQSLFAKPNWQIVLYIQFTLHFLLIYSQICAIGSFAEDLQALSQTCY
jgi:hypothetical protein